MSDPDTIIEHKTWTLQPDREPDSQPVTHAMRCVVCGEQSDDSAKWSAPQTWALGHVSRNPMHLTFSEVITRPWKAWMRP
ncbi:DUF7848 domain-containing protein [Streptomyces niveus]|uniref:DUF7848 domain-containing protein n=1 Tax=Streptomyces niveus TaxID=193462 RepID=UPI0003C62324|nr:hypothetical protein M877_18320 [Streptomyces niveus NCIMB 11891]